ncbi:hypothetical protein [Streptomyces sp. NPDC056049]|uniref:hypothetical protein n=1 Tax=Streptomyces sp. NPDC056049 TaxID=3345693 RepID=UPI0035D7655A
MAYWSYILTAVGVFGLWLAGRKSKFGWAVGLGAQVLWLSYAVTTEQWGFILSAVAYGWVYSKNFLAWRRAELEVARG